MLKPASPMLEQFAPMYDQFVPIRKKPVPLVSEDAIPFWEGCKRHELLIQKCQRCGNVQFPPRVVCTHCMHDELDWIQASGKATVYSFSVIHRTAYEGFAKDVPYVLAVVDLDEGVRMTTNIIGIKPEDVRIGAKVKVTFRKRTNQITLPQFRPI